jgi:hypothetical protein
MRFILRNDGPLPSSLIPSGDGPGEARTQGYLDTSPRRAHASRVEIGRNDWAAPEPVTGNLNGGVAHLAERLFCTQRVAGSSPVTSTISLR